MSKPTPAQAIDHLVLFVPVNPDTKLPQVPDVFKSNFTLSAGGVHADGATSNVLVLLADGCYIELISFVDPSKAPDHWWGPDAKFTGWKDWCLTNSLTPEENHTNLEGSHAEPIPGGRKRADFIYVQWAVTFPKGDKGGQGVRGRVPFFCHDITPRNIRVPLNEEKTTHSCGALGIQQLTVIVKDQTLLDDTKRVYKSILDDEGTEGDEEVTMRVGHVHDVDSLGGGAKITLRLPKNGEERERVEKACFWYGDVILVAKAQPGKPSGKKERLDGSGEDKSVGGLWIDYI
ncbi:hypothetical protein EJ02DRAFT_356955 [Clathrospora elynae]|uniref:Glyoxalase-like domain-containing protein n=1 Tax=Clathrospora elynae TaxID=706981 RepID=A0A6A5SFY9_9PLEO|nr:hypothetical protein EJ02DRAFT_356955 [Clathrospora elynae]